MFQDVSQRPLPSEIEKLDTVMQMKRLFAFESKENELVNQNVRFSYEVLLAGECRVNEL